MKPPSSPAGRDRKEFVSGAARLMLKLLARLKHPLKSLLFLALGLVLAWCLFAFVAYYQSPGRAYSRAEAFSERFYLVDDISAIPHEDLIAAERLYLRVLEGDKGFNQAYVQLVWLKMLQGDLAGAAQYRDALQVVCGDCPELDEASKLMVLYAPDSQEIYERIRDSFHKNSRLTDSDRAELSQLARESQSYRDLAINLLITGASSSMDRDDIRELIKEGIKFKSPVGASLDLLQFNATLESGSSPSDGPLSAKAKDLIRKSDPGELSEVEKAFVKNTLQMKEFRNRIVSLRILIAKTGLSKDDKAWAVAQVEQQVASAAEDERVLLEFVRASIEMRNTIPNPAGVNSHSKG